MSPSPAEQTWCWACDERIDDHICDLCAAPQFTPDHQQHTGVYVAEAACGLFKIGVSTTHVPTRVATLRRSSATPIALVAVLWGASFAVERFLHQMFCEQRDPNFAKAEGLSAHTEWFWPTPGLLRLVDGDTVAFAGESWDEMLRRWPRCRG